MFVISLSKFLFVHFAVLCLEDGYDLIIVSDSPIAEGTSVTFNVSLTIDGMPAPKRDYQFRCDFQGTKQSIKSLNPNVSFVVNSDDLKHGHYNIEFAVDEFYIFLYLEKVKKRATFEVTNHFTGLMELVQGPNNTIRENGYVSSESETLHNIVISEKDKKLYAKAAYVRVFWFIDCLYVGMTDTLNFRNWYRSENGKYNVEALLMLSYEPLPTPTSSTTQKPTTTTPTTTSTTTPSTTTSTTSTSTTSTTTTTSTSTTSTTSTTTTTTTKKSIRKRRAAPSQEFEWNLKALIESGSIKPENVAFENMTEPSVMATTEIPMEDRIKMLNDNLIPYFGVCTNFSKVIIDPKKIYGYYQRTIIVENPVDNVTVANNVWLRHGDMCQLIIKFSGTAPFKYCTKISRNDNDTASIQDDGCDDEWKAIDVKEINYKHFFPFLSNSYTLKVLVKNEVSFVPTTIGIQFYEGESLFTYNCNAIKILLLFLALPPSQLSVVIVPVVFSLMAVVVIVFGVAYYVQNRNRFLVEVADFNFGETQSVDSMEYKSFIQRLLDSISDLFIRNSFSEELDSPDEPSNSYNAMP